MVDEALQELNHLREKLRDGCTAPQALELLSNVSHAAKTSGRPAIAASAEALADAALDAGPRKAHETIAAGLDQLQAALAGLSNPVSAARVEEESAKEVPPAAIAQDPELLADFVNESREHIAAIEAQVLQLENDPQSMDSLHAAFRGFHTIKGLAGFLELADIREVSHEVETLLDRARNGQLAVTPEIVDIVLQGGDYLNQAVAWVETGLKGKCGAAPPFDALLKRVRAALSGEEPPVIAAKSAEDAAVSAIPTERSPHSPVSSSLRVDAAKLDSMIDMVGELMIAQSLVMHSPELANITDAALLRNLQHLRRVTGELQRTSMGLRMASVAQLFGRMTRIVRDLSRKNGKAVRLDFSGEETELDKTIIEQLADPLMHMVRNSLDHGLEPTAERAASGKPPEGRLLLAAYQQAGQIVIQVSDDGRGLNSDKILRKARERGIVAQSATPSESEIFHLIFEPGFSTAEKVTDVSGRGVGMDVVRRQIQALRGRIDIESTSGKGTAFYLRLPLTLAIVEGLIVAVGREHCIIPVTAVQEMLRPTPEIMFTIEGRAEMAMVRGNVLPVVRLGWRFGIDAAQEDPAQGLLVVVSSETGRFAVLVDSLIGKQEVVSKSLGDVFQGVPGISGGAILGDGRVGLILDVNDLAPGRVGPS